MVRAVEAVANDALSQLDLSKEPHPAPHPRQGAVDMISFMPLSEQRASAIEDDLNACEECAWQLGARLGAVDAEAGTPVLMYGRRAGRTLVETRRGTHFFRSTKAEERRPDPFCSLKPDFAPKGMVSWTDDYIQHEADHHGPCYTLPRHLGVSIIGVQTYVTNFNVCVEGASLEQCKAAAAALRSKHGVQVMALPHEGETIEIGCNLQASDTVDSPSREAVLSCLRESLPESAGIPKSYVIGLTPDDARQKGEQLRQQYVKLFRLNDAITHHNTHTTITTRHTEISWQRALLFGLRVFQCLLLLGLSQLGDEPNDETEQNDAHAEKD